MEGDATYSDQWYVWETVPLELSPKAQGKSTDQALEAGWESSFGDVIKIDGITGIPVKQPFAPIAEEANGLGDSSQITASDNFTSNDQVGGHQITQITQVDSLTTNLVATATSESQQSTLTENIGQGLPLQVASNELTPAI